MGAPPGWYPDPAGTPGLFRYWDGTGWSATTTRDPQDPAPRTRNSPATARPPGSRRGLSWLILGAAVLVVIVLIGVFAVRQIGGIGLLGGGTSEGPSTGTCPANTQTPSAAPLSRDGRVHGGRLSYPRLPEPWDNPSGDSRIPFGRDVQEQFAIVERGSFLGYEFWGAAVLVGELVAGDGFYAPKDGTDIVVRCVVGTFYGDTTVSQDPRRSEAITVDGRNGWVVQTNLGFDIPTLQAKHELLTVVVVDIGDGTAGLFLATVPENGPQFGPQVQRALEQLRVDD